LNWGDAAGNFCLASTTRNVATELHSSGVVIGGQETDIGGVRKQGVHPMPTHDEYRKLADEYYSLAAEAKTETDRLALLDLAHTWLETASRQDDRYPERIGEPDEVVQTRKPKSRMPDPQTPSEWRRLLRWLPWR
jgi:hypothetical protein